MTPLALIIQARGGRVEGSDRALDQGRNAERFDFLRARGVLLHPQDGSGISRSSQILVTSAAVEETVPDVQAARRIGAAVTTRARLLAQLFNCAGLGVGVAGTSGKSTTVGMIGWILHRAGRSPTIMNGADMKNFIDVGSPVASARVGDGDIFVSEVDESDGSIAFFEPRVAVVNNISLDHKSLDELRTLFRGFIARAQTVVLNLDNAETAALAVDLKPGQAVTYSLRAAQADLLASPPDPSPTGIAFRVKARDTGETVAVELKVPGLHNVANALAALSVAKASGVSLADAAEAAQIGRGFRHRHAACLCDTQGSEGVGNIVQPRNFQRHRDDLTGIARLHLECYSGRRLNRCKGEKIGSRVTETVGDRRLPISRRHVGRECRGFRVVEIQHHRLRLGDESAEKGAQLVE